MLFPALALALCVSPPACHVVLDARDVEVRWDLPLRSHCTLAMAVGFDVACVEEEDGGVSCPRVEPRTFGETPVPPEPWCNLDIEHQDDGERRLVGVTCWNVPAR